MTVPLLKDTLSFDQGLWRVLKGNAMPKSNYDLEDQIESSHWWFVVRKNLLKSVLSSGLLPLDNVAVDVGCGAGSNLSILKSLGFNVFGLDRSCYALSLVTKKLNLPVIAGDLTELPFRSESVGLIVAMDVLEHLESDFDGIHEIYRTLKKGGALILTVPAFGFLRGTQDIVTGHKRRYSMKELINKLEREEFEIIKSSYFNFFLFFPILIARHLIYLLGVRIESENTINAPFINFILKGFFSLEPFLLKYVSFPFGVSIFCIAKKRAI